MDPRLVDSRYQRVMIRGQCSEWSRITSSVVQGSVQGVLLAIMFLDGIDDVIKNGFLSKYVDDNKLAMTMKNKEDRKRFKKS